MESGSELKIPHSPETFSQSPELDTLGKRILGRDQRVEEYAHAQWLENGRDLLKAKAILGHGNFEEWCERALNYSSRTAQKMMRAAEVMGPILKNEPDSVLVKPSMAYLLSAPSVTPEIRAAYVPRVVAGEDVADELRIAIKDHRIAMKEAKVREARGSPEARKAQLKREEARARREAREAERLRIERERRAKARSAALTLILAQFGDVLPTLIALAAEAGSGSVFSCEAERELQTLALMNTTSVKEEAGFLVNKPEATSVITDNTSPMSTSEPPASSEPMNVVVEDHATEPSPNEPVLAGISPPVTTTKSPRSTGKFGNLSDVVESFPSSRREHRAKFTHSRA